MSIIDYTYFRGDIVIAQLSQQAVMEDLEILINKYEPKYLKLLLGLGFYNAFIAGIDPISGAEQRWIDLLEGVAYTTNGKDYEWMGFTNDLKESVIANYVYYSYVTKEVQQTVGIGQVKPLAENAANVNPTQKLTRVWNEMVEWQHSLIHYLDTHKALYPEWVPYPSMNYERYDLWFYNYYRTMCHELPVIFRKINSLGI
jgi:hypothetical protein